MGAEKINLDELKKAREELNVERGIVTSEQVKKSEKQNIENESSKKQSDEFSSSSLDENLVSDNELQNDSSEKLNEKNEQKQSVEEVTPVVEESKSEQNLESKIEEISEKIDNGSNLENDNELNSFDDILLTLLNDTPEEDFEDKYNVDEIIEEVENETKSEDVQENSNYINENIEETKVELEDKIPEKQAELHKNKSNNAENTTQNNEKVNNTAKNIEENQQLQQKPGKKEEINNNLETDDFELKPIYLPNVDVEIHKNKESSVGKEPDQKLVKQKIDENSKQENDLLEQNTSEEVQIPNEEEIPEENLLKKIEDAKFISLIRSKEFMGSDNLTCIYGVDEEKNVYCQNFKDFYNTAIFCENDDVVFDLFSSIIMSLLLKNTKFDVRFAICDAKIGGKLTIYNNLSYMFFDRVAESNREIIEALKEISLEIDNRYKSLAKAGVNSIEKFNREMKKAKIAPLPYLVLFFNNYSRAYHLDDSNEINIHLSYILRFGRLVGVYVNVVSFDENLAENINFNLQTRIAYKTDLKDTSISEIGEEGAEKIGYSDEYIIKTLYSDKLIHLKAPKITQKEIELLIKNIEKK